MTWKKIKVREFNYKIVAEDGALIAENITPQDIDTLTNAEKMKGLLEKVLLYEANGTEIDAELAEEIAQLLSDIEGKEFGEKVNELLKKAERWCK